MDQRVGLGREVLYEKKHHSKERLASREIEPTPDGLVDAVLARIHRSSAFWQQYGHLHDVVVVEKDWGRATYYEEMPLACVQDGELGGNNHYYTVSLEFEKIEENGFIHPVIRRWSGRRLVSEKHLPEDLSGEWKKAEAHIAPLRYFFMEQLLESAEYDPDLPVRAAEKKYARFAV